MKYRVFKLKPFPTYDVEPFRARGKIKENHFCRFDALYLKYSIITIRYGFFVLKKHFTSKNKYIESFIQKLRYTLEYARYNSQFSSLSKFIVLNHLDKSFISQRSIFNCNFAIKIKMCYKSYCLS